MFAIKNKSCCALLHGSSRLRVQRSPRPRAYHIMRLCASACVYIANVASSCAFTQLLRGPLTIESVPHRAHNVSRPFRAADCTQLFLSYGVARMLYFVLGNSSDCNNTIIAVASCYMHSCCSLECPRNKMQPETLLGSAACGELHLSRCSQWLILAVLFWKKSSSMD